MVVFYRPVPDALIHAAVRQSAENGLLVASRALGQDVPQHLWVSPCDESEWKKKPLAFLRQDVWFMGQCWRGNGIMLNKNQTPTQAFITAAHEAFHWWQYENGMPEDRAQAEKDAENFAHSLLTRVQHVPQERYTHHRGRLRYIGSW